MSSITIRPLHPAEWAAFKEIRLQALRACPGVFSSSYEAEVDHSPEQWRDTIRGPGHQAFGLHDVHRLIGITAVFTWRDDPTNETAVLAMSFILPEYRGRGLARQLYEARLDWIRMRPQFKRIVVSHRESNEMSRRAIERHGFSPTRRVARTWPDGTTEDEMFYELLIAKQAAG